MVGVPAPLLGMGLDELTLSWLSDTSPDPFSLMMHAWPAMAAVAFAVWWSLLHRPAAVLCLSLVGVAAGALLVCVAYLDAFKWHLDPQSGLVVLFSPVIYACGAGYGLLVAAVALRTIGWIGKRQTPFFERG